MTTENLDKKAILTETFKPYLKIGILDCLTEGQNKELQTYYGPIKPASFNSNGDSFQSSPLIIKELDEAHIGIYSTLSKLWNPYLETIFGIVDVQGTKYSLNECITPPDYLANKTDDISLSLETFIRKNMYEKKLSEQEALIFLYQLCEGLKVLHKKKLFHGDISPQNILLTTATYISKQRFHNIDGIHNHVALKMIDFGNTKEHKEENHEVTTTIGTKPYAAPDILDFHKPVEQRADIYSLGCILGFMLTGYSPKEKNIKDSVSPRIWRIISKCTATYHERFANVSKLQHRILKELDETDSIAGAFLQNLPGFRSKNIIKMIVASYFYFSFLFGGVCMAMAGVFPACIIMPFLFLLSVVSLFDVFHVMDLVKRHCYFLRKHNILAKIIQIIAACVIIFTACMILGGYL